MDYKTKPISRLQIRCISQAVRQAFGCQNKLRFDVVDAFERTPFVFPLLITTVVEDDELPKEIPARCTHDCNGHYIIEVKNTVYEGAAAGVGGYRGHILHEICHGILCCLGYTPILERSFKNKELHAFESMEWQAKALCGEILIPYDETSGMTVGQITNYCKVSIECAELRVNEFQKKKKEMV